MADEKPSTDLDGDPLPEVPSVPDVQEDVEQPEVDEADDQGSDAIPDD
jgi:hypothetical protein